MPTINITIDDVLHAKADELFRRLGLDMETAVRQLLRKAVSDDAAIVLEVVEEKLADAQTPGFQAEFDPDEAELAGAFVEDALSHEDALEAATDAADELPGKLAFLNDEGPSDIIPPFVTTANAREMFGLRPGETVAQAAARKAAEREQPIEPTFVPEGVVLPGLPAFVDVDNVVSLYGWQPGESLDEAIARSKAARRDAQEPTTITDGEPMADLPAFVDVAIVREKSGTATNQEEGD